jgi:hypothetical protein
MKSLISATAFGTAWGVVKDREGLTPEERKLPGGDALVGPPDMGGASHPTEGYFPSWLLGDDGGVIPGMEEALAHADDKERERILARGIKEPRRPKIRPAKSKRPDFEEYAREFAGSD